MNYTVFQIKLDAETISQVNTLGREEAISRFPVYKAYFETMFEGSQGFQSWMSEHFQPVCEIDADNLDQAFEIGNIGPEHKIVRHRRMHSVSVGDIIRCNQTNRCYMVDGFGFTHLLDFVPVE